MSAVISAHLYRIPLPELPFSMVCHIDECTPATRIYSNGNQMKKNFRFNVDA